MLDGFWYNDRTRVQHDTIKHTGKRHSVIPDQPNHFTLFGSSLVQYAIMWYITLQTQSGLMMTISIICGFLPTFFLAPFAGWQIGKTEKTHYAL